jgi:hypothetical protein
MPTAYRVHVSIFPLGSSEPQRALAALREYWVSPFWIAKRQFQGGWLVEAKMEAPLPTGDTEIEFAQRLSIAVWHRLGRYVRVVVDASPGESDESHRSELNRADYLKLMRTP